MQGKEDDSLYIFKDADVGGQPVYTSQWMKFGENVDIANLRDYGINDAISAMWVHPRISATVWIDANMSGKNATFNGSQVVDLNMLKSYGLQDNISSIQTRPLMSFDSWKLACCRNQVGPYTDSVKCGKYWSQDSSVCGTMDCADKLVGDPPCATWCEKNPIQCDSLKIAYCQQHPGSMYCGCINDTQMAIDQRTQYASITAPRQCWSQSDCQKTDLVNTLVPTGLKPLGCPNVNALIQNQNITNSNLYGSNLSMSGTQNNNSQQPPQQPKTSIWIFIGIFIIIIFIISAAVYLFMDDSGDISPEMGKLNL